MNKSQQEGETRLGQKKKRGRGEEENDDEDKDDNEDEDKDEEQERKGKKNRRQTPQEGKEEPEHTSVKKINQRKEDKENVNQ